MAGVEDPFAAFGDSSDDDDDSNYENSIKIHRAKSNDAQRAVTTVATSSLVSQAAKVQQDLTKRSLDESNSNQTNSDCTTESQDIVNDLIVNAKDHQVVLPWPLPLYVNADCLCLTANLTRFGGGRGYVATQDLPPGTLVLLESPLWIWSSNSNNTQSDNHEFGFEKITSVQSLQQFIIQYYQQQQVQKEQLNGDDTHPLQDVFCWLEHLHPTKVNVDNDSNNVNGDNSIMIHKMIEVLRFSESIDSVVSEQQNLLTDLVELCRDLDLTNSNGSPITETDLLRIMLVLRYNSLESGVYLHVAMLNHADSPNCVKFQPRVIDNTNYRKDSKASRLLVSEVCTTRHVAAGEALTISYIPYLLSHVSRRYYLWQQHRFDIGTKFDSDDQLQSEQGSSVNIQMEQVHQQIPVTPAVDEPPKSTSVTVRIENTLLDLEEALQFELFQPSSSNNRSSNVDQESLLPSLEQSALGLVASSKEQLGNDQHVLLIRCYQLHLQCCDAVAKRKNATRLTPSQHLSLLGRVASSAYAVIPLQRAWYGPDHFDLATTNLDLAEALEELLATCGSNNINALSIKLTELTGINMSSMKEWTTLAQTSRQEFRRIEKLYDRTKVDVILQQII